MRYLVAAAVVLAVVCGAVRAQAQSCQGGSDSSISQYGITITFDQSYSCGTFANGDYWVVPPSPGGTVTIDAMTPVFDGAEHGWEVNPDSTSDQGFDHRAYGFDASRVPSLPYAASADESIVKAISVDSADVDCRPCLQTAMVLTVLDTAPPADGATTFRPGYFGADKPIIDTSQLDPSLLPSLAATADAPTLDAVAANYQRVQLDHQNNWIGRFLHPADNMPDYGSSIGRLSGDAALRLMLDDSAAEKQQALVNFVQFGIDLYAMLLGGQSWPANGGHHNGRKIALVFAATLLDHQGMKDALAAAPDDTFGEDGMLSIGAEAGEVIWGQSCSEQMYWQNQTDQSGSRTCKDPYGYIDGGETPGGSYQFCCNSGMWKGTALALLLMPELRCLWNHEMFLDYVDRWVSSGAVAQPDPCAPSDGDWSNYGVTFGPDGNGGCIADTETTCTAEELAGGAAEPCIGRWPHRHGSSVDGGSYTSGFHASMWTAYRSTVPTEPPDCDGSGSGGAGGTGGGIGTGGGTGNTGGGIGTGGTGGTAAAPPIEEESDCSCRLVGKVPGRPSRGPWLLAALGIAAVSRRRQGRP